MKRLDTYGSNSPTQPGKVPIPHPSGTDNGQMPVGCPGVCWNLRIEMATAWNNKEMLLALVKVNNKVNFNSNWFPDRKTSKWKELERTKPGKKPIKVTP